MLKKKKHTGPCPVIFMTCIIYICLSFFSPSGAEGCSMVLVGKDATVDGSVLLAHNNDLPGNTGAMIQVVPGWRYAPGEMVVFKNGLQIPRAEQTYGMLIMNCYFGFAEGDAVAVNRHQVAIAGGTALKKDRNPRAAEADPLVTNGMSGYIRYIALQRAKTARECVEIIGEMYSRYGISYPSACGVADPNEVWYLEAGGGKCWVAQRVPDDAYLAVANGYRIGEVDFKDKANFIYPPYLKEFTIKKGLWKPGKKKTFNFAAIFGGQMEKENNYYNARRVWRIQQLLTPSVNLPAYGFTHPVTARPDRKVTIPQLIAILRDYYKGTPFDISNTPGTGERAIGVFNTVHTDVIQLRNYMPAEIGAVMWAGVGSALTTPYIPYYLGVTEIPSPYGKAGPRFDLTSAFWNFRTLTTLLEPRFPFLNEEILPVWQSMETDLFSRRESVEKAAMELYKKDKEAAVDFLTAYSSELALNALQRAKELKEKIETQLAKNSNKKGSHRLTRD